MSSTKGTPLREAGENRLLERFRELASAALTDSVVLGPGDDAAAVRVAEGRLLLLTCDMLVEDIHFRSRWSSPQQIGWKAMAQNLSDIAAMGGRPAVAVASVAAPSALDAHIVEEIAQGLIAAASQYGGALVGGDLVGSPGPLVVDVALTGYIDEDLMLRRSGARPGDVILVTGSLGASAAGLVACEQGVSPEEGPDAVRVLQAHREPRPRLAEARAIAQTRRATAMMDLSDGLLDDLPRLCAASGVGARVSVQRLPVDSACAAVATRFARDPLQMAAAGGEDYELLLTCPAAAVEEIAAIVTAETGTTITPIGDIIEGRGVTFRDARGHAVALESGFDHFADVSRGT